MKLEALGDHILVERAPEKDVSDGGIIIPECAKAKSIVVTVRTVGGQGRILQNGRRIAPLVKPGDVCAIGKYCGSEMDYGGQTLLVVKEGDIQARIVMSGGVVCASWWMRAISIIRNWLGLGV